REKMDLNKLEIENSKIKEILDYFIDNGYNPNRIPEYGEEFGIYTENLYFKIKPKIFDFFYVTINKNNLISIGDVELNKEKVIQYIKSYKKLLIENKKEKVHIVHFSPV